MAVQDVRSRVLGLFFDLFLIFYCGFNSFRNVFNIQCVDVGFGSGRRQVFISFRIVMLGIDNIFILGDIKVYYGL